MDNEEPNWKKKPKVQGFGNNNLGNTGNSYALDDEEFSDDFEEYFSDEEDNNNRLTKKAGQEEIKNVMNVYQDYLFKKNPQPKQLTTIKEDSKDNYSTSTDNSSKNISLNDKKISGMNERKKNMRSKCIEAMGKRQFEDIYTY